MRWKFCCRKTGGNVCRDCSVSHKKAQNAQNKNQFPYVRFLLFVLSFVPFVPFCGLTFFVIAHEGRRTSKWQKHEQQFELSACVCAERSRGAGVCFCSWRFSVRE